MNLQITLWEETPIAGERKAELVKAVKKCIKESFPLVCDVKVEWEEDQGLVGVYHELNGEDWFDPDIQEKVFNALERVL